MTSNSLPTNAVETLKKSDKIYLENYTVNLPFPKEELEKNYSIKVLELKREQVENESILSDAKSQETSLLVYGDSLSATTHMHLILECKKLEIPYKIYHNASIMISIAETGLSLYKFGKTASMPNWAEHTNKPTSFINYIKQNQSIEAHSLILTDIGLEMSKAISQLQKASKKENFKLPEKIIAVSHAGTTQQKIFYDTPKNLQDKNIPTPFCLIIPTKLHFLEEEALEKLKI